MRFRIDGGWIEETISALKCHEASGFGIPLIRADADADGGMYCFVYAEAFVARAEVEFFLVAGSIRNVGLAIHADLQSIGIGEESGIEVCITGPIGSKNDSKKRHKNLKNNS